MSSTRISILSIITVAFISTAALGQEPPKIKSRGDLEEKFYSQVCLAILKAAHPTGKQPSMSRYELKETKKGLSTLSLRGSYKGRITSKEYVANIAVIIYTLDKDNWEVLRIDYSDNNNIPQNRKNLDNLRKQLNRK